MREKLYPSDQSTVLLQSPDNAGTAGGETMCIKNLMKIDGILLSLRETKENEREKSKRAEGYLNWSTQKRQQLGDRGDCGAIKKK